MGQQSVEQMLVEQGNPRGGKSLSIEAMTNFSLRIVEPQCKVLREALAAL